VEVGNNVWRESAFCTSYGKTVDFEFVHVIWAGRRVIYLMTLFFQLQTLRNFEWQANLLSTSLWHVGRRDCGVLQGHTQ
jgi:hypothetical protein